ncbi:MAG: hypothetical protein ACPHGV_08160 [Synechococcus sp.]
MTAVLALSTATVHAAEAPRVDQHRHSDGSSVQLTTTVDLNRQRRQFRVELRRPGKASTTVLNHSQALADAPTGGATLSDVDADGVVEIVERTFCGAGPNCAFTIFKLNLITQKARRWFEGSYAQIEPIGPYLVTSNRSSCCSWTHQILAPPDGDRALNSDDIVATIAVTAAPDGSRPVRCLITTTDQQRWDAVVDQKPELLRLCEIDGNTVVITAPSSLRR